MNTIASPVFFVKHFLSFRHLALFFHSVFRHFLYNDSRRKTSLLPGRNQGFLSLFCGIHLSVVWPMIPGKKDNTATLRYEDLLNENEKAIRMDGQSSEKGCGIRLSKWSRCGRARIGRQSTGHLHLDGFESHAIAIKNADTQMGICIL